MTTQDKQEIEKDLRTYIKKKSCAISEVIPDLPLPEAIADECCRDELLLFVGRKYGVHIPDAVLEGDNGLSFSALVDVIHASRMERVKKHH